MGKKLFIGGIMMIMMSMMIVAVVSETTAIASSAIEIYTQMDNAEKSAVTSTTVAVNNTQTAISLYNYQYLTVNSLPGYAWNYYYVDLNSNSYVSISHASRSGGSMEILMNHYDRPTIYSYSKKNYLYTYQSTLTSDPKSYYNRLYIAVRNTNSYASNGYTLSVRIYTNTVTPTPTTTTIYRTNYGLTLGMGVPALVITLILFFVVLSQIKKIKLLTSRIEQLEKKLQYNMQPLSEQEMPVMMNIPLMSANTLQQDHEEIQQVPQTQPIVQPPTINAVPEQQPTTLPHFFPQFVQQQQLPPQFRNAQPYPFMYPPQVVFAQQPQVQPVIAQQQTTGQSKQ